MLENPIWLNIATRHNHVFSLENVRVYTESIGLLGIHKIYIVFDRLISALVISFEVDFLYWQKMCANIDSRDVLMFLIKEWEIPIFLYLKRTFFVGGFHVFFTLCNRKID